MTTARNRALQQHIPAKKTGGLFGLSQGMRMLLAAAVSAHAGWWLDRAEAGWQQIFFGAALAGFLSLAALASIRTRASKEAKPVRHKNWVISPWKDVFKLLKRRKDFLRFEGAFMIYGFAFMMLLPLVPIYLVDNLKLSYATIGLAKGTVFQVIMIAGIPLFGKWFDRSTPHRMAAKTFATGALYPLTLLSASFLEGTPQVFAVLLSFCFFGVTMSGINVIWNLASMRFAGSKEDAGLYQSVHLAATGIRGLFAPLLGFFIMHYLGKPTALVINAGLWIIAAVAMIVARRMDFRSGQSASLRAEDEA
jgi:MFS family permease